MLTHTHTHVDLNGDISFSHLCFRIRNKLDYCAFFALSASILVRSCLSAWFISTTMEWIPIKFGNGGCTLNLSFKYNFS